MLLVNGSLKFQIAIFTNTLLFFQQKITKKDSHIFSTKNNSVFAFEVDI